MVKSPCAKSKHYLWLAYDGRRFSALCRCLHILMIHRQSGTCSGVEIKSIKSINSDLLLNSSSRGKFKKLIAISNNETL